MNEFVHLDEQGHLRPVRAGADLIGDDCVTGFLLILRGLGEHRPADNEPAFWPAPPDGGRAA